MIDDRYLNSLVERIVANYAPEKILLFGSQAKQQAGAGSDIDLLIIKSTSLPMGRRGRNVVALLADSPVKVDLLFYTPEEIRAECRDPLSFISSIMASARVIYAPGAQARDEV